MHVSFHNPRIEYVTVTPEGFRYRGQIFPTVNGLFRWFKDHYQDPVPGEFHSLSDFWSVLKRGTQGVLIVAQWVKNPTSIHEEGASICGLTQWVKDLALPQAAA